MCRSFSFFQAEKGHITEPLHVNRRMLRGPASRLATLAARFATGAYTQCAVGWQWRSAASAESLVGLILKLTSAAENFGLRIRIKSLGSRGLRYPYPGIFVFQLPQKLPYRLFPFFRWIGVVDLCPPAEIPSQGRIQ